MCPESAAYIHTMDDSLYYRLRFPGTLRGSASLKMQNLSKFGLQFFFPFLDELGHIHLFLCVFGQLLKNKPKMAYSRDALIRD